MNTTEYIILIIITVLALLFIVRTIVKLVKGETPCMFCKSCGDEEDKSSCSAAKKEVPCDGEKTQEYDMDKENE